MMRKVLVAALLLMPLLVYAATEYQEGVNYEKLLPEQPGAEGKKIQVMEFFMYGCGHCNNLEPYLLEWLKRKPEDVEFVRVPAMFDRPDIIMHAKVYYALQQIGADAEIHSKIFHAIHAENKRLRSEAKVEELLQANGIDIDEFRKAMHSFAILTSIRKAAVLAEDYNIHGVPALAVDGKYLIGGQEGETMIGTLDQLIGEVRKVKASASE